MYINFWYPIAPSADVTNEAPHRTHLLGHTFVAFRDTEGKPHVLADTCIHRGGALGAGKVVGDRIQCPYHGWQYDGAGQCKLIPALEQTDPGGRAKVDSYPTKELHGMLFAFLGDLAEDERPPLYEIEEYEDENWRAAPLVVFETNSYYERNVENGLDPAHNEFVHPKQGAPGMKLDFNKEPINIDLLGDYGSGFMMPFSLEEPENAIMNTEKIDRQDVVRAGSGHIGPHVLITWLHFDTDKKFHQYAWEVPIDENRTRIFFINMRRFMRDPEMDQKITDVNMEVADEDIEVLEKLYPVRTPETLNNELLIATDAPVVKYREFLKDWQSRGWRIDQQALQANRGNVATAIPSPARRNEKNWVHDSVPLLSAKT